MNTDLSSNSSKALPRRGSGFCHLLQWRASCTSTTLTFTNSSTKMDNCIHETFLLLSWFPVISYILWQIIHHVCFRKWTEHFPSSVFWRELQKLLGFQEGNRKKQEHKHAFLSVTEKTDRCSHSLEKQYFRWKNGVVGFYFNNWNTIMGNMVGNFKKMKYFIIAWAIRYFIGILKISPILYHNLQNVIIYVKKYLKWLLPGKKKIT